MTSVHQDGSGPFVFELAARDLGWVRLVEPVTGPDLQLGVTLWWADHSFAFRYQVVAGRPVASTVHPEGLPPEDPSDLDACRLDLPAVRWLRLFADGGADPTPGLVAPPARYDGAFEILLYLAGLAPRWAAALRRSFDPAAVQRDCDRLDR